MDRQKDGQMDINIQADTGNDNAQRPKVALGKKLNVCSLFWVNVAFKETNNTQIQTVVNILIKIHINLHFSNRAK